MQIDFPEKLQCLFEPKRTKVLWGGRGAGRSWGVARALLLQGTSKPLRILCVREFQKSIDDSVHKLLSDQIEAMGLSEFYDILKAKITGKNGTTFSFEGIKNNTQKVKSYEGIDICWVEEAIKVSKSSWGILIPTIRKPGSEIWMTFNPDLATDYTYQRFVLQANPANSTVVRMNYLDNPWFPEVLREEMEGDRLRDPDHYLNIWEGHCLQALEGAVYAKEIRKATEDCRICRVPADKESPIHTFWDLGRGDNTAIWFAQEVGVQYRILAFYQASNEDIGHFLEELQRRRYLYGFHFLPHDAKAKHLGSKLSIQEQIAGVYPGRVKVLPRLSVVDGISAARTIFPRCWFDEEECEEGLHSLRHYRYKVVDGQRSNQPLHDWASDGADAFRYLALGMKSPKDDLRPATVIERLRRPLNRLSERAPGLGWMRV